MSGTRKAPVSVISLTGAMENGHVCETVQPSTTQSTTPTTSRQRISDLLGHGQTSARWRATEIEAVADAVEKAVIE